MLNRKLHRVLFSRRLPGEEIAVDGTHRVQEDSELRGQVGGVALHTLAIHGIGPLLALGGPDALVCDGSQGPVEIADRSRDEVVDAQVLVICASQVLATACS